MSLYDAITKKLEEDKKAKALNSTVQKTTQPSTPVSSKPITSILSDTINQLSNMKPVEPVKRNVGTFTKTPDIAKGAAKGFSMALQATDKVISPVVQPLRDWSQTPTGQSVKGALTSGGIGSLLSALPKTMVSPTKVTEPLQVLADRGVNSATFGALDYLMPQTQAEKYRQENHPIASTVGTLGGYLIPGVGVEKGIMKALPQLAKVTGESILKQSAKRAGIDALSGGIMGSVEGGLSAAVNKQDILEGIGKGGLVGGAMGGALGGIIGGVGGKLEANKIFKQGLSKVGESIDNYKFPQIREQPVTLTPEQILSKERTLPKVSAEIPARYQQPLPKLNEPLMLPEPSIYSQAKGRKDFVTPKVDIDAKINTQKQALNAPKIEPNIKSPLNKVEPVKTQNKSIETDDIRIVDGEIFYKDIHATTSKRGNAIFTNKKSFFSGERKILELPKSLDSSNINTANMVKPIDNVSTNKPNLSTKVEPDIATGKTKNRQFIENSYMESDVTTPKMKAEMKNKIPEYPEISNQKTLDEANKIIGDDVDGNAKRFLEQQELNSALDTAKGISLIQKAIAKGDVNLANDISINLAEKLTTAGQTVQAASIFKRMTPEGMLQYANKQISKYNSANPTKKISGLTEAEASKIVENMNLINAANNGELKLLKINLQLFAETKLAEIFKLIGNKIPADMGQKLRAFQRINLLLNPKTMVRNVTGNVFSGTVGNLSDTLRAGLDKGISKITGKRTALLPNLKTQLKGAKKGFDRVKSDWINDVNTSPTGTQYELGQGQNAASPFKNKPLKFLDKITTTGLRFGDDPFYQGFYDDALQQQMKIAKVTEPTSDMIKQADQIARERTFQDTNYMTKLFSAFQRGLNHVGTQNFGLGNIVLPFVKTPANILARALEYSPVEIGKGITKALYDAGKGNAFNQYKLVDSLAKGLTGTALLGAGYELAKRGIITGNAPKDTDTRKYMEANGILPYSFKMGDGSYTYDWAQPSSIPIAIGADIYYNLKDKKDPANALLSAGESGIQTLMSQSLVQGLTKFFGGGQYGSSIGENLINTGLSSATQFVPFSSLLRNTAEVIDPVKRNTYDSESQLNSYLVNPIKNTIPGFRQKLPEKVNTFGEKTPASGFIDTFINPAREGIGTKVDTKVNDELMRLSKVGQNKQFPTLANKTISYKLTPKGETKKLILPPKQLSEYQQKLGLKNLEAIKKTINSGNYQMANDKQKADMISNEMSKVKQQLETELLKQQNISEYKSSSGGRSLRSVRSGRTGR